jgi:hypothetical protein
MASSTTSGNFTGCAVSKMTALAKLFLDYGILPNNSEMIILYGNPDPMASFR